VFGFLHFQGFSVFQKEVIKNVGQNNGYVAPDTKGSQPYEPGSLGVADFLLLFSFDENILVFVDDCPVLGMLVYDVYFHSFLVELVDAVVRGQGRQPFLFFPGYRFILIVKFLEEIIETLVVFVDDPNEKEHRSWTTDFVEHFMNETEVIASADKGGPLKPFADPSQNRFLLFPEVAYVFKVDKEEIVGDSIAVKKNFGVIDGSLALGEELNAGCAVRIDRPIHDQAVKDLFAHQVFDGLVSTKHVFAETAAAAFVVDTVRGQNELVSLREKADEGVALSGLFFFEEIAVADAMPGDGCEILYFIRQGAV
jgi:hypothetical protein